MLSCFSRVQLSAHLWTVGSSVHGSLQARILEWVAISYSRGPFQPWNGTYISYVSCAAGGPFTTSATHLGLPFSKLVYTVKNLFLWSILLLSNLSLKMFGFISSEFYLKWTTAMVQSAGKYFQNIIDIKCTLLNQDSCHRFTGK